MSQRRKDLKNGMQVPPAAAGIIIVLVVAVVGFFLYKATSSPGKVQMTPENIKKMQQGLNQRPTNAGPGMGAPGR